MQFDLGDFQSLAKKNAGNRYLLLGVDVLSRQMYGAPTKSKRPKDMIQAFEEVFKQLPFLAESIYTDRGNEFVAKEMKQYFEEKGIEKYETKSSAVKAAVVERAIRTLKNRLDEYAMQLKFLDSGSTNTLVRRTLWIGLLLYPNSYMQSIIV
jgi:IS30 family transposase